MAIPVEPIDQAAAAAPAVEPTLAPQASAPEPAGPPDDVSLPPELIAVPAVQALLAGSPAAVSAPIAGFEKTPEGKAIVQNKDTLMNMGLAFYRSLSGDLGVVFNQMKLPGAELQAADKAGKLLEIAPPIQQVSQAMSSAGVDHPLLNGAGAPTGAATAAPSPIPAGPPPGAGPIVPTSSAKKTQDKILATKMANLPPGSPTSGPKPGQGRILNQILKPVL